MARKVVRKTPDYLILQRRDNRYAVLGKERRPVNGDEKVAILLAEGLIAAATPAAPAPAEAPAENGDAGSDGEGAESSE